MLIHAGLVWEDEVRGDGRRVVEFGRVLVDRAVYRAGGVVGLLVLDAGGRHELRVRRRCGMWRYRELMGRALVMPRARQRVFQWRLRRCARRAKTADLSELLDYGWRERLVAGWLIAVGRRAELRPRIAADLKDPQPRLDLHVYCLALACLGTEQDAQILRDYLIMSLPITDQNERHCQAEAMAALLHLDQALGADHAGELMREGYWARWPGSERASLDALRTDMMARVDFARGVDPGVRAVRGVG